MSSPHRSLGKKLLWGIGAPALVVAVCGVFFFWRQADKAVDTSTREQAAALAEVISTTFALTDGQGAEGHEHRAVTEVLRSDWKVLRFLSGLRILSPDGKVRWSRNVEEKGK